MDAAAAARKMTRSISRQLSSGAARLWRQLSLDPHTPPGGAGPTRFAMARLSSLDPTPRAADDGAQQQQLAVPENLDATMRLLFAACQGDAVGVEELLRGGVDVNSIDLDSRTALHIAACEGQGEVVRLLLDWKANINARDRWGSTPAADAKHYGHFEVYNLLRARGARIPKTRKTPMAVLNPKEVPEYELNPLELEFRRGEDVTKGNYVAKWYGSKVFVKILDKDSFSDADSINAFKHELTLLEKARHPNLVQFVGAVTQNVPMMIVSEYHQKGDLASYIEMKGHLKSHKAIRFALDIARGLNYLHECKPETIIHGSLSAKNIMRDDEGKLKVAGFGSLNVIKVSEDKLQMAQPITTFDGVYIAPEIYRNEPFDRSIDVFAFGLILYEMIEGAPAFHPKPPEEVVKMICLEGLRPPFKNKPKYYPHDVKELIRECWDPTPSVRPTFAEIIVRLNKIHASCAKQTSWRDTFKLPWKQASERQP
ncbi:integrin-linked protein kinase 1-like [Phragmites australis]|uniref:integrin-linked protein kinase 1-like n=1 Tax=Phragmites australis TaxID=29695 RepID=UPI002D767D87|nr:integrin-linked protein kinase 1-like [Phragmites australis]